MTKTQIKKRLGDILSRIQNLQCEVEDTRDNIEMYDCRDDLTEQQQERYDWLDELASLLGSVASDLEEYIY